MNDATNHSAARAKPNVLFRIFRSHDFARDLTVTTLGVLIALLIGAIVEDFRWRLRLAASERMMDEELGSVRGAFSYHMLSQQCIVDKLNALFEITDRARVTRRLPDIRQIGFTHDFGTFGDSWALTQQSDVILHMTPKAAMDHASTWVNVRYASEQVSRGQLAWQQLGILSQRPGNVSADFLDGVSRDLIAAVNSSQIVYSMAKRMDGRLNASGISRLNPSGTPFDLRAMREQVRQSPICEPLQVDGRPYVAQNLPPRIDLPKELGG